MTDLPGAARGVVKTVLVAGSARRLNDEAHRATRLVGTELARRGFGLVTGSWTGVDREVSDAFLRALREQGHEPRGRYLQVHQTGGWRRPFSTVVQRDATLRHDVPSDRGSYVEAISRSDAGILIGGLGGVKKVAFELIGSGRPVFPLPLTGGDALAAYAEILERWSENAVPGVTRSQFMQLSLPLRTGAHELMRLLSAALGDRIDVFVSYRRADQPAAAGRLADELSEHLGVKRVFLDTHSIAPGAAFSERIRKALEQCQVLVCLIGSGWDVTRLSDEADYVRREVVAALDAGKAVIPIVAYGGQLPDASQLPDSLRGLLARQAVFIRDNDAWSSGVAAVLREVDRSLHGPTLDT